MRHHVALTTALEPAALAQLARLRYVCDQDAGYSRRRNGQGFAYLNCRGQSLRDVRKVRRIESLVIPPAWKDVWICPWSNGHLQATGRDSRGRKQYLYHERWQRVANVAKFARLAQFGQLLPTLRSRISRLVAGKEFTRERVLGGMVALLDVTGVRVGNEEYVKENGSYGLTTLRDRHVFVRPNGVELRFRAKGGFHREVLIEDRELARFVVACAELRGARLFQCVHCDGRQRPVQSADVNDFLQGITGQPITAKDFRTWKASSQAAGRLFAAGPMPQKTARKRLIRETICEAANLLSNTPAVCRNYYVHPGILESYEEGTYHDYFGAFLRRRKKLFTLDEQVLASFLGQWKPEINLLRRSA